MEIDNLTLNNTYLKKENLKLKDHKNNNMNVKNNYEVIENIIENTENGLTKKEAETLVMKYLLTKLELEKLNKVYTTGIK